MSQPAHDGDDYLTRLYRAVARSRATTQELEELIAEVEGLPREALHQRRRRTFKIVAMPSLLGAGAAGKALFGSARRAAATTAAAVVTAGGIGLAVIQTPHHPPSRGALPGRPPVAAPPGVRSTPKVGPPKTRPPARPVPRRPIADHSPGRRQLGIVEVVRSPVLSGPVVDTTSPAGLPAPPELPGTPVTSKRCLVDGRPALPIAALCSRKS